ncbi:MAG: hypothetical protein A4E64_02958 [Syntrophorhabdus sp. PtaU1.Bin058]|nr:MAG: hypothetical protein A4E64_02958 [Syntrophorhabdus sp. PtaU1.Bin058]
MDKVKSDKATITERQSDNPQERSKLTLEIASAIRSVIHLFHEAKDPRERQVRQLLSNLAEDRFNPAVIPLLSPPEKGREGLLMYVERTISLLTPERIESCAGKARIGLNGNALRTIKHTWEFKMRQIETECTHTVKALQSRIRSELPLLLDTAITRHCIEVHDALMKEIDLFLAGQKRSIDAQDLHEIVDRARIVVAERRRLWLSDHREEFVQSLSELSAEDIDRLERFYNEALDLAARLFRIEYIPKWNVDREEVNFSWQIATPFEWKPRFAWELDMVPLRWIYKRVRRDHVRTLEAAIVEYRGRVVRALAEASSQWVSSVHSEVRDSLRNLGIQVAGALSGQAVSSLSEEVDTVLSRLEVIRLELIDRGSDKTATLLRTAPGRQSIHRCLVCERIKTELFNFFCKRQYELSVNEARRREHARAGGFCPLHTWQYAQIAAPQDISLAYAPLLAAVAHGLYDIASSASSADSVRDGLNHLLASTENCSACLKIMEAEKNVIEEFLKTSPRREDEEADAGLCVVHLGAVLNQEIELETARNLVLRQADVLNRISENMQTYSLKYDAVRRELVSEEELMAWLFGLSLLVGHKGLSMT